MFRRTFLRSCALGLASCKLPDLVTGPPEAPPQTPPPGCDPTPAPPEPSVLTGGPAFSSLIVWPLGDSKVQGDTEVGGNYPANVLGGWRANIWRHQLGFDFAWSFIGSLNSWVTPGLNFPQAVASHDGHSGAETADLIAGMATWWGGTYFNCGILDVGTNDINHSIGPDVNGQPGTISNPTKYNGIASRVATICASMNGYTGAHIFYLLQTPLGGKVAAVNQTNQRTAAALAGLSYVTVVSNSLTIDDMCDDAIHPLPSGYQEESDSCLWPALQAVYL